MYTSIKYITAYSLDRLHNRLWMKFAIGVCTCTCICLCNMAKVIRTGMTCRYRASAPVMAIVLSLPSDGRASGEDPPYRAGADYHVVFGASASTVRVLESQRIAPRSVVRRWDQNATEARAALRFLLHRGRRRSVNGSIVFGLSGARESAAEAR